MVTVLAWTVARLGFESWVGPLCRVGMLGLMVTVLAWTVARPGFASWVGPLCRVGMLGLISWTYMARYSLLAESNIKHQPTVTFHQN